MLADRETDTQTYILITIPCRGPKVCIFCRKKSIDLYIVNVGGSAGMCRVAEDRHESRTESFVDGRRARISVAVEPRQD